MTVSSETRVVEYEGDGVSDNFPITFEVLDRTHVVVSYQPSGGGTWVVLTQGTNPGYDVDGSFTAIKSVFPAAASTPAPVGSKVRIERVVPITQVVDLTAAGTFDPETHEDVFDLGTMVDQQLADRIKALETATVPGNFVAGNGCSLTGSTLNVNANADGSIISSADDIRVGVLATDAQHGNRGGGALHNNAVSGGAAGFQSGVDKQRADALWGRTITAGAGLTGGGDLSANRTIDVVATDGSIVVAANSLGVGVLQNDAMHGALGGGSLHTVAVAGGNAGFLSGADKTKLDGLVALNQVASANPVVTSDATPTTLLSFTPTDQTSEVVDVLVIGTRKSGGGANGDTGGYRRTFTVKRVDGTTSLVGAATDGGTHENVVGWDVTVAIASPAVNVQVTGAAATIVQWSGTATRQIVSRL